MSSSKQARQVDMARNLSPHQLLREFRKAVPVALDEVADKLNDEFQAQIEEVKWAWPNKTKRKKGPPVTSPRNIVDVGTLRDSQTRENVGPLTVEWTWKTDYSAVVHNGPRLVDGQRYKHRPWTEHAEKEVQPLKTFADRLRRELDG